MKGHEEYKDLLAQAALDADGEDARALEAHLAACADCRAELRELRDAASALALAADPVMPSPELRARILDTIKRTPQESPASAGGAIIDAHESTKITPNEGARVAPNEGANVVPLEAARSFAVRRRAPVSRSTFAFGAVAASLVLFALAAASFVLWQRNSAMRSQLDALSTNLNRAHDELAARNAELERERRERELLASPNARKFDLSGTRAAESARARLVLDTRTGEALLTVTNLPPAPAGRAYQLWYIADGKTLPGPVFTTDERGHAETRGVIPPEGRRAQSFAVSVEQPSGAQSPTGEIVLKSNS